MKKLFFFVAVSGILFAATSCKKDRVCSCDVVTTGIVNFSITIDTTFVDVSKDEAGTKCTALNSSYDDGLNTVKSTCELK
jgi:hypothetical protein